MKRFWRACRIFIAPSLAALVAVPSTSHAQERKPGTPVVPGPQLQRLGDGSPQTGPVYPVYVGGSSANAQIQRLGEDTPLPPPVVPTTPKPGAVAAPYQWVAGQQSGSASGIQQVQAPTPSIQPPASSTGAPTPSIQPPSSAPTPTAPTPGATTPGGGEPRLGALGASSGISSGGPGLGSQTAGSAIGSGALSGNAASSPSSNVAVGGSNVSYLAATDAGNLISKSNSVTGVESQRRSQIAFDTRVRGYHLGEVQTWADGVYWFPARQDLDTFLSKIDAGLIQDVLVLKGPYTVRRGPGLSFIDISTFPSPRAKEEAFEYGGETTTNYKTNGEQLYGQQNFWAAGEDWGVRGSYSQRIGSDYRTGDGRKIPSKYDSRTFDFVAGADLTKDAHLEFGFLRIDQTGVDFPGQVFDTDFLVTNGFRSRFVLDHQEMFDTLAVDGYYNETHMKGDAQHSDKRQQIPELGIPGTPGGVITAAGANPLTGQTITSFLLNPPPHGTPANVGFFNLGFLGFTDVRESNGGYRTSVTWGEDKHPQLTVGTDMNIITQRLDEFDSILSTPFQNFAIPPSHISAWGAFADFVDPISDSLTFRTGVRGDYSTANVDTLPIGVTPAQVLNLLGTTELERDWGTWMAYATADYKPVKHWTFKVGAGHGEVAPTLTELYALDPFLATIQQGLTNVIGNPGLKPERSWQIDVGISADYDRAHFGATAFQSWVQDYITFQTTNKVGIKPPFSQTGALNLQFVNTDLATLDGFELYGDVDVTGWLTPFGTMSYVEGIDQTRDHRGSPVAGGPNLGPFGAPHEPLSGIPPLVTRLGFRLHEDRKAPRWSVELATRIDAAQHRVAESLNEFSSSGYTVWDLRAFWQPNQTILVTAGVENLFDKNYRDHLDLLTGLSVFEPGITPYIGLQLRY